MFTVFEYNVIVIYSEGWLDIRRRMKISFLVTNDAASDHKQILIAGLACMYAAFGLNLVISTLGISVSQ